MGSDDPDDRRADRPSSSLPARHWRRLFETSGDLMCIVTSDGQFLEVNGAWERVLGWTEEELLPKRLHDLLHPDDRERGLERMRQSVEGRSPTTFESRYRTRDGAYRWVQWSGGPIMDGLLFFAIGRDVTDQRRAREERDLLLEVALRLGRGEDLEAALAETLEAVCRHTDWDAAEVWLPTEAGDALTCSTAWFAHGRAVKRAGTALGRFRSMAESLEHAPGEGVVGTAWKLERPVWSEDVTRDPSFRRSEAAEAVGLRSAVAIPIKAGLEVTGVLTFFLAAQQPEDEHAIHVVSAVAAQVGVLLERRRIAEERAEREARLQALTETAQDAIVSVDGQGRIIQFNARAEDLFGRPKRELLGEPVTILMPHHHQRAHTDAFERFIRSEKRTLTDTILELEGEHADGSTFPMELSLSTWVAGGQPHVTAIIRDIRRRRTAERALRRETELTRLLRNVAMVANQATDAPAAIERALQEVCDHTGWPVGHAYLLDPEHDDLYPSGIWATLREVPTMRKATQGRRFERGQGLPGRVLETGEPAWIEDVEADPNFPRAIGEDLGVHGAFALPILLGERVLGVLEFYHQDPQAPDADLLAVLEAVGAQLGPVLERDPSVGLR